MPVDNRGWRRAVQRLALVGAVAAGSVLLPALVQAQGIGGYGGGGGDPEGGSSSGLPRAGTGVTNPGSIDPAGPPEGGGGGGDDAKGKEAAPPPPPALPGSHAQPTSVIPADKVVTDMDPSSALFDAINRGDAAAARDAINRGANLDGHNVLGLTPIELSVDLNRNDISFLLLSMRGAAGTPVVAPKATASVVRAASVHPAGTRRGEKTPVPVGATAGGAAPDAGFLGFGGSGPS